MLHAYDPITPGEVRRHQLQARLAYLVRPCVKKLLVHYYKQNRKVVNGTSKMVKVLAMQT